MKLHTLWLIHWLSALACSLCMSNPVLAHKASDSYLSIELEGQVGFGRWDVALKDLEHAIGLDDNNDGALTWAEVRARHASIEAYALDRLVVKIGGKRCTAQSQRQLIDNHSDGAYSVLQFSLDCPEWDGSVEVVYNLLFDLDHSHRGLLSLRDGAQAHTSVLTPQRRRFEITRGDTPARSGQVARYWREGLHHIFSGLDHLLFLLVLLLPSVLFRRRGRWQPVRYFSAAAWDVFGIVTAFTVAHSVTLTIAVLGWVTLPATWVEVAIAATVLITAIHNLYPFIQRRRAIIAFALGLVHGFGFANALGDLGVSGAELAWALAAFNIGVESGQLALVLVCLPVAFLIRRGIFYRRVVLQSCSALVALVALGWLFERGFNTQLGLI